MTFLKQSEMCGISIYIKGMSELTVTVTAFIDRVTVCFACIKITTAETRLSLGRRIVHTWPN